MAKRLLQFVALCVVLFLAAEPALAGMSCTMGMSAGTPCASDCAMSMSAMGADGMAIDCPMPHQVSCDGCQTNCCRQGLPQTAAQLTFNAKPKAVSAQAILIAPVMAIPEPTAFLVMPPGLVSSSAPPIYLLHRVFRI